MPTDIIIYAVVAAVMVFWLKNVIGTRHGEERQRPNPFEGANEQSPEPKPNNVMDNVIDHDSIAPRSGETAKDDVEAGLVQIALADRNFDSNDFKENATDAFTMIVTAFAEADRETLQDLCTDEVYKAFDAALVEREAKGETVSTEIHSVRKADIVAAGVEKRKKAFVAIRFTADETYVIEDKDGNILAGHPDRVTEMTDKWTFSRDVKSSDPRWFLSKTEDDVIEEDGKTPMPDAG